MQTITPECATGKCQHASYPHKIVTCEAREAVLLDWRTQRRERTQIPAMTFVVCLACNHWLGSGAVCGCDCHLIRVYSEASTSIERC
jgi:hypothetical protein